MQKKRLIEVNIFDFDTDIYDTILQVHIHAFIRNEIKFSGLDTLIIQLKADAIIAKKLLQ